MLTKIRGISLLLVMVLCGLVFLGVVGLIRSNRQATRTLSEEDERIFAQQSASIALVEAKEQIKRTSLNLTSTCDDFKGGSQSGRIFLTCEQDPLSCPEGGGGTGGGGTGGGGTGGGGTGGGGTGGGGTGGGGTGGGGTGGGGTGGGGTGGGGGTITPPPTPSSGKFYGFYMQGCPSSPSSSCRLSSVFYNNDSDLNSCKKSDPSLWVDSFVTKTVTGDVRDKFIGIASARCGNASAKLPQYVIEFKEQGSVSRQGNDIESKGQSKAIPIYCYEDSTDPDCFIPPPPIVIPPPPIVTPPPPPAVKKWSYRITARGYGCQDDKINVVTTTEYQEP